MIVEKFPTPSNLGNNWTARVRKVTGNADAAELAARIAAFVRGRGVNSIKLRREDWSKDLAMPVRTYERALALLKSVEYQIITTRRVKFFGILITEIKLTERGEKLLFGNSYPANVGGFESATVGGFYIEEGLSKESLKEVEDCAHFVHAQGGAFFDGKNPGEADMGKSVKEIMSLPGKKPKALTSGMPATPGSCAIVWREVHSEIYPGIFIVKFGTKEEGQFGLILKRAGAGRAHKCIEFVLRHWIDFAEAVKKEKGYQHVAAKPDVGFLLLHVGVAVNMIMEQKDVAYVAGKPPTVVVKKSKPKPKDIATLEDILGDP